MPDEYLADMGPVLKKVATAAGADQFNILQNNGKMAFQVRYLNWEYEEGR